MPIYLGSHKMGDIRKGSGSIARAYYGSTLVYQKGDPYNPLNLPPYTIRVRFPQSVQDTFVPTKGSAVEVSDHVYDYTYENSDWTGLFSTNYYQATPASPIAYKIEEVLGANTTGVTAMYRLFYSCDNLVAVALFNTSSVADLGGMFYNCYYLTSVPLFDTSSVTNMGYMFYSCSRLTTVPLFDTSSVTSMSGMFSMCQSLANVPLLDTSSVTNMDSMFYYCGSLRTSIPLFDTSSVTTMNGMWQYCSNVTGGSLALYQQASAQNPVPSHRGTFSNCGINTPTGAAELAQIPSDWK